MVQMKLVILGSASAVPTAERSLPSVAVVRGGEILLFDVGEGAQRAMAQVDLSPSKVTKVFITHLHGDHCVGLLGLMQTLSLLNREKPLDIYGPRGIVGFVKDNMKHLNFHLTYPVRIHVVTSGVLVSEKEYQVKATQAEHSVPAYSYILDEYDRPGVFYPEKASALGVPEGQLWSRLQRGEEVHIGRRVVKPSDVLGPKRPGRKIGISGDTRPSQILIEFYRNVDALVFDSTYAEDYADKAELNVHSTAKEAAVLADKAGVKLLILTHFSARYDDVGIHVAEASSIHRNVAAASDLMEVNVPYPS